MTLVTVAHRGLGYRTPPLRTARLQNGAYEHLSYRNPSRADEVMEKLDAMRDGLSAGGDGQERGKRMRR